MHNAQCTMHNVNYQRLSGILFFSCFTLQVFSQSAGLDSLKALEKRMQPLAYNALNGETDSIKKECNKKLIPLLVKALQIPESFTYPFDSLATISKLMPMDSSFRIFTWYRVDEDENYHYFGCVHLRYKNQLYTIPLIDKSNEIRYPEVFRLSADRWLGALYYKLITYYYKDNKVYVLCGWNGNNEQYSFKLVDVINIHYPSDDSLSSLADSVNHHVSAPKPFLNFGKPIFINPSLKYRFIQYYRAGSPVTLNYDPWKKMIVFDFLVPATSADRGDYHRWVPSGYYQGLKFKRGFFMVKKVKINKRGKGEPLRGTKEEIEELLKRQEEMQKKRWESWEEDNKK